jgi:arylsulfatase A-like enzyme
MLQPRSPAAVLVWAHVLLPWLLAADGQAQQRPNVVLVLTDDQGYGDLGAHGNTRIRTPNLDRLHAESVRLTNYHVDPTCSPTRSALMSGRYSTRTGVWHTIMGRSLMRGEETTVAEEFRANGYRTGMFGKWHLGDNAPCRPQDQGFEHVVWHHGGGVGQGPDAWGNDYFDDTYEVDGLRRAFDGYCTDVWFAEARRFIEREDARPFFVYLATNAPHGPYLVDESYWRPYAEAGVPETMARFYGMIENIDENVGKLRARLDELGLLEDTIFLFTTDNGTAAGDAPGAKEVGSWRGFNAGMRGRKGSEYDGGHRVPLFVRWPKGGIGGGRDVDALTAHVDVLPTLRELCGLEAMTGAEAGTAAPLDGTSLAAALRGTGAPPRDRTLFVHSQRIEHPQKWRKCAVMTDRWRLVGGGQLFDIRADPGQERDVAAEHAEVVASLRAAYEGWWRTLEPEFERYVRIDLGGAAAQVELMSHDWHTEDRATPWHQSQVEAGLIANGPWAVEVRRPGTYEFTLRRWPAQLDRAMDCVHAALSIGDVVLERDCERTDESAVLRAELPAGPAMLTTKLRRHDGKEHGAYFVSVRMID